MLVGYLVLLDTRVMAKRKTTDYIQINVRMREGLRAKLEQSAKRNDESLNREIVDRLEQSFDRQELLVDAVTLAYGRELGFLLLAMGKAADEAGKQAGAIASITSGMRSPQWTTVPYCYQQAANAMMAILHEFKPKGEYRLPDAERLKAMGIEKIKTDQIGISAGVQIAEAIKGKAPPELRRFASMVRPLREEEAEE